MARKTKEETEKTRHALLDAAAELFLSQGVVNTTLNEIAKRAGVTRGAVYWHFSGKADIIQAIWETYAAPRLVDFRDGCHNLPAIGAGNAFRKLIVGGIKTTVTDAGVAQAMRIILHNNEFAIHEPELHTFLCGKRSKYDDAILSAYETLKERGELRPDVDPELATMALLCYFHGLIDQHFTPDVEVDLNEDGDALINLFLNAVLVAPAT